MGTFGRDPTYYHPQKGCPKPATGSAKPEMFRKDLLELLSVEPRSVSRIAREMGLSRGDVEEDLRHMIRSARTAGHAVIVVPARCRTCGFVFSEDKLSKPGKCPQCKGSRIFEPQIRVEKRDQP